MTYVLELSKMFLKKKYRFCKYTAPLAVATYTSTRCSRYLYTASEHFMQHVSSSFHQSDIGRRRVQVLAVSDGVYKPITELLASTQQARLHKTHHAVIYEDTCQYVNTS